MTGAKFRLRKNANSATNNATTSSKGNVSLLLVNTHIIAASNSITIMFLISIILFIGLNNSLKACETRFMKLNENNCYVNDQDYDGYFNYLDDTIKELLPNASVKFAPLIASDQNGWKETELCQLGFRKFNEFVRARGHVEFDSYEPLNTGIMEWDMTHMADLRGIEFWERIFQQL